MKTRTRTTHSLGILDKWGNCDKWGIRGTLSGLHSLRRVTLPRMLNIGTVSKLAAAKTRRSHSTTTALAILVALASLTAAASTNTLDPGIPPDPNPLEALMDGLV